MIYKFINRETGNYLEVEQDGGNYVLLSINEYVDDGSEGYKEIELHLNTTQLYDLIGALHSLQTKIKKGGSNG